MASDMNKRNIRPATGPNGLLPPGGTRARLHGAQAAAQTHNLKGLALVRQDQPAAALKEFARAVSVCPMYMEARANYGRLLVMLKPDEPLKAIEHLEVVVAAEPKRLRAMDTLVSTYSKAGLFRQSLRLNTRLCRRLKVALSEATKKEAVDELTLRLAGVYNRMGFLLQDLGYPSLAVLALRRALTLAPAEKEYEFNLALALLLDGQWREGFERYETRWEERRGNPEGRGGVPAWPLWQGQPVKPGSALLVLPEQGFGDSLQFGRYLLWASTVFDRVTFKSVEPLDRLFRQSFGDHVEIIETMPMGRQAREYHWHAPLLSLPRAHGTTPEIIPSVCAVPYLKCNEQESQAWHQRVQAVRAGRPAVGIVWAGLLRADNPGAVLTDGRRSLTLASLAPLLRNQDICWFSLQKTDGVKQQIAELGAGVQVHHWIDECPDFAATAALVDNLDLVISADTAMAHLSGGIGAPVWLLSRFEGEWRWLWRRKHTDWYPGMSIFHQSRFGDWDEVVTRVDEQLRGACASASPAAGSWRTVLGQGGFGG
jgi:tetratricopeptide (TPR) repeat protein